MPGESQSIAQGGVQKMAGYWDDELLSAALHGDLIKVRTALENGANPNAEENEDLISIIALFAGKIHSMRSHKKTLLVQGVKS